MKCTSMWSYRPYRPMDWPHRTVEVARMAPGPDCLELDYWPETPVEVHWRGPQEGRARLVGGHGRLEGLEPGGEYALSLALPGGVSGPWIPFARALFPGKLSTICIRRMNVTAFQAAICAAPAWPCCLRAHWWPRWTCMRPASPRT